MEKLKKGTIIADSVVKTKGPTQSLGLSVFGLHRLPCAPVWGKLSLYENYKKYLDLVDQSTYNEKTQELFLLVDHTLLPFSMSLHFKLPRIRGPGKYPFTFTSGFLKGLLGTIEVRERQGRCLLIGRANWEGSKTKIPDGVFELFTKTLLKLAAQKLFIISRRG